MYKWLFDLLSIQQKKNLLNKAIQSSIKILVVDIFNFIYKTEVLSIFKFLKTKQHNSVE